MTFPSLLSMPVFNTWNAHPINCPIFTSLRIVTRYRKSISVETSSTISSLTSSPIFDFEEVKQNKENSMPWQSLTVQTTMFSLLKAWTCCQIWNISYLTKTSFHLQDTQSIKYVFFNACKILALMIILYKKQEWINLKSLTSFFLECQDFSPSTDSPPVKSKKKT